MSTGRRERIAEIVGGAKDVWDDGDLRTILAELPDDGECINFGSFAAGRVVASEPDPAPLAEALREVLDAGVDMDDWSGDRKVAALRAAKAVLLEYDRAVGGEPR